MHGDEPFGLCREFDLISEFFGLDEDLVKTFKNNNRSSNCR